MGQYVNFYFQIFTVFILTVGLVVAMREYRQQNNGWMRYREGLSIGLIMFAVIGLLDTTYQQVYQTYINPSYTEITLEQTRNTMERFGATDDQLDRFDEQIEKAADKPTRGEAGSAFIGAVLVWIFGGFVLSLVVSAFMRKVKTNPFD